ncbi:hypothetical protein CPC08DRAFT_635653 [Agrocybe pediades]|nr:hypothetical protein CPC08DRAFT_635653 [Agrocybe pediades]
MTSSDLFCILVWDENSTRIDAEIDPIKQVEEEINQSSVPSSPRRFGQYLTVPSPSLADLDWELRLQRQAFENSRSVSSLSPAPSIRLAARQSTFECGVCGEYQPLSVQISLAECGHKYCNACLSSHVKSKIEDSRYPIFCPECLAEYSRIIRTRISESIFSELNIDKRSLQRLKQLQILSHSVSLDCAETVNIEKESFGVQSVIKCPAEKCGHKWCNNCMKDLTNSSEGHRCKNGGISKLMRRKGWRYCPGCKTPVQKSYGCNHITCSAPGCNVHFCYRCGSLMIDTTNGGDIGTAVTEHYYNCRMFEKRLKCSIQ